MKVYTRHLGDKGVDEIEVEAPMGVRFEVGDADFEVTAGVDGCIEVRLTGRRGGVSALVVEPRAANSINVKVRRD